MHLTKNQKWRTVGTVRKECKLSVGTRGNEFEALVCSGKIEFWRSVGIGRIDF